MPTKSLTLAFTLRQRKPVASLSLSLNWLTPSLEGAMMKEMEREEEGVEQEIEREGDEGVREGSPCER